MVNQYLLQHVNTGAKYLTFIEHMKLSSHHEHVTFTVLLHNLATHQ